MQRALASRAIDDIRLVGFDSFQGLPESVADEDDGAWRPGDYASDLETTRRHLSANGVDWSRTTLVPGWYEETLTPGLRDDLGLSRASVIMIDCDAYSSSRAALEFCAPLIGNTVIFFDDWHAENLAARGLGQKRAFDEFLLANPELKATELDSYAPPPGWPQTAAVFHCTKPHTTDAPNSGSSIKCKRCGTWSPMHEHTRCSACGNSLNRTRRRSAVPTK